MPEKFEDQIAEIIKTFDPSQEPDTPSTTAAPEEAGKRIIHADKYTLPNGDILFRLESGGGVLIPHEAMEGVDAKTLENHIPLTAAEVEQYNITHTPTVPLTKEAPDTATPPPAPTKQSIRPAYIIVPLFLLLLFLSGTGTYLYLLPMIATADITITPLARTIHKEATLTIATQPKIGQVQGRSLESISLTKTKTAPATGHGHDDAQTATGEIVFYNTDISPVSIPAGVTFTVNGIAIITSDAVTIPAAKPPIDSQAVSYAHAIQAGSQGNIPANAIYTHCCSASVIATNVTPFSGGQDARDYSYVQSSDIQNATSTLLPPLTSKATAALTKQARIGESVVTPVCSPHTTSSAKPGSEAVSVTVSVTQTCSSIAYLTDSLNQTATSILAHTENLANYAQVGTVQVTVNGSTYTKQSAQLKVSLSGVWLYNFSQRELTHIKHMIAGMSKEKAQALLQQEPGVQQVTISLSRLDLRDQLPTDTSHIHILLIIVS
jgi:hypothetical protein